MYSDGQGWGSGGKGDAIIIKDNEKYLHYKGNITATYLKRCFFTTL